MIKRFGMVILSSLLLAGCSLFSIYRPDIQQGHVIHDRTVDQLRLGMTKEKVKRLMGESILRNTFSEERKRYVYTLKSWKGNKPKVIQKRVVLTFKKGQLVKIDKT